MRLELGSLVDSSLTTFKGRKVTVKVKFWVLYVRGATYKGGCGYEERRKGEL
jgi:hypothetical protein